MYIVYCCNRDFAFMLLQLFTTHMLQLLTSRNVVCDVSYVKPQNLKPGEISIKFTEREIILTHKYTFFVKLLTRFLLVLAEKAKIVSLSSIAYTFFYIMD